MVDLIAGDCRDLLPTLPEASVHCVVTSPPYWGLRDYGVDGQLGLEPTPEAYLAQMVAVFRAVRRVLRDDGTLWMNMGSSYQDKQDTGMPWRLAFALQADGWYLRADIIWAKPNPMPESVTDRPTKAHEYVFLLSKKASYFYDADAVREPQTSRDNSDRPGARDGVSHPDYQPRRPDGPLTRERIAMRDRLWNPAGRNLRSVWTIPSAPFPDAHFATFPPALASRCILAGSSEKGCCAACGAPWARQTNSEFVKLADRRPTRKAVQPGADMADVNSRNQMGFNRVTTTGWAPTCACAAPTIPCTVLDPFAGSGTTGQVAEQLGRHSILIELSPAYVEIAKTRTAQRGLFAQLGPPHLAIGGFQP